MRRRRAQLSSRGRTGMLYGSDATRTMKRRSRAYRGEGADRGPSVANRLKCFRRGSNRSPFDLHRFRITTGASRSCRPGSISSHIRRMILKRKIWKKRSNYWGWQRSVRGDGKQALGKSPIFMLFMSCDVVPIPIIGSSVPLAHAWLRVPFLRKASGFSEVGTHSRGLSRKIKKWLRR